MGSRANSMGIMKYFALLLCILGCMTMRDASAQKDPPSKEMRTILPGTWLLKFLYVPDYNSPDERSRYYPIDDDYINQFVWEEVDLKEYRSGRDFDLNSIDFAVNGNFKGEHYNGTQVNGKWQYKLGNKKKPTYLSIAYTMHGEGDEEEYQYNLTFDRVALKDNQLILIGDVCNDACVLKVILERYDP